MKKISVIHMMKSASLPGARRIQLHGRRSERARRLVSDRREEVEARPCAIRDDLAALRGRMPEDVVDSAAFQSVAMVAARILGRAMQSHRMLKKSAISLAHQDMLRGMEEELQAAADVLSDVLREPGLRILGLHAPEADAQVPDEAAESWWFALSEALNILENDARLLVSICTSQPRGAAARELGEALVCLLLRYHDALLVEAERWMD